MELFDQLSVKPKKLRKNESVIKLYVCGPTVYDEPHLGHLKTYIIFDVLAKYLRVKGKEVFYIQNITDIDDKIIKRAEDLNEDPMILSKKYLDRYMEAMIKAGINSVSLYSPATTHIRDILAQIKSLERKGYTYKLPDGVYYRVWMDRNYGKLSKQNSEKLISGKRATVSDMKEDQRDFVLWKFKKSDKEPAWNSPWGLGRPGWHIEDTAIASKYFGKFYNIHGAGMDLMFPHHESELSILTSLKGNGHVSDVWMYSGLLRINGSKMSKSENNYIKAMDVLDKYSKEVVRLMFLSNSYGSETDFSWNLLDEAKKNVDYITRSYEIINKNEVGKEEIDVNKFFRKIDEAMERDLNTRSALVGLLELSGEIYKHEGKLTENVTQAIKSKMNEINSYLGVIETDKRKAMSEGTVEKLINLRNKLRQEKMFKESDMIREGLKESGVILEDKTGKTSWYYESK
jgi:cysteinyl-tRNA synthetase